MQELSLQPEHLRSVNISLNCRQLLVVFDLSLEDIYCTYHTCIITKFVFTYIVHLIILIFNKWVAEFYYFLDVAPIFF